ncbi:hypothetical protein BDQ17DRAFT_1432922 [Cyathus striatus]|nr:hypothetical protein BDQ17DRAFT_1432922 [Cyathus striatus]
MADEAWHDVDVTTIWNCWTKSGILPVMDSTPSSISQPSVPISSLIHHSSHQIDPVLHSESLVEDALDQLEATGALQKCNWMTIDSLLNLEGESHVSTETSDNEIFQAVMDSIAAHENLEVIGGDDVDEDIPVEPLPTHRDVLKAISTIKRYTEDMDDPFSCKVDTILGSFN